MKDHPGRPDDRLPMWRSQVPPAGPPSADYVEDYRPADPAPPAGSKRLSFRLVLRGLRRHWWQALLLWLVGTGGLLALISQRVVPTFDASSQVRVELDPLSPLGGGTSAQFDLLQFMQSQTQLILSPKVIGAALSEKPELARTPLLRGSSDLEYDLRQALRVGVIPRTNLIQIELSSPNPSEAAVLVNAVVSAYLKLAEATYDQSTQRRIDNLKQSKTEQELKVENKRKQVQALDEQIGAEGIEQLKDHNNASAEAYRRLSEQLIDVEIKVITLKAKLDQLRSSKDLPRQQSDEQINLAVSDEFFNEPAVLALQELREAADEKLRKARRLSRNPGDPAVVNAAERVSRLKEEWEDLWKQLQPKIRRRILSTPVDQSADAAIKQVEAELSASVVMQETLKDRLEKVRIEGQAGKSKQNQLEYAKRDLQRAEGVLDRIDQTLQELRFTARNPTARVERVFEAKPSNRANADRRHQMMAASPLGMGLLVIGLFMLLELRGARVSDPEELASRMQLQVIGVVPPLPQIRHNPGPARERANGNGSGSGNGEILSSSELRARRELDEFVQSLDHLRVALCARRDPWGRDRHCVLITSAIGSEGKTTLAAQLAERCVNAGLMTLLIDGDLRNPTLSRMLDAAECPGLINILRGEMLAEDVIRVVGDAGGFHLLPAGTPRIDPSRLLHSERLANLVAQARGSFDMIIIDAPPVLPVPDALTIGRLADGAVLAVRHDTSRFPLVEKASRRLAQVGVPIIGAVVNGVRSSESSYGGYYAYGYGASAYGNVSGASTVGE